MDFTASRGERTGKVESSQQIIHGKGPMMSEMMKSLGCALGSRDGFVNSCCFVSLSFFFFFFFNPATRNGNDTFPFGSAEEKRYFSALLVMRGQDGMWSVCNM